MLPKGKFALSLLLVAPGALKLATNKLLSN